MGRLFGYVANRTDQLGAVLAAERQVVAPRAGTTLAGWGVGFYHGGEVLHKKRPLLEGEVIDWEQVAGNVTSDCVVGHLRQATVGDFRAENTHPFRMRSWLFAHNGTVDRFDAVRPHLVEQMPDFLRRNIRGQTDSEHIFHTILSFLHDGGHLDRPDVDDAAVVHAIRSSIALLDRLCAEVGAPPATLNQILTNGRKMFALRRGAPMHYVQRDAPETALAPGLRYALIVSDGMSVPAGYAELAERQVCILGRDLSLSVAAI